MQTSTRSFQDLQVYQLAFQCSVDLYNLAEQFPDMADMALTQKLLATSRTVRAEIAAAWGQRRNRVALLGKLSAAHLATTEMQTWLETAIAVGDLDADAGQTLHERYRAIGMALDQLMATAAGQGDTWAENPEDTLPATA
ncbi:MAG: four helix bundle protein [Thainema sp.]